MRLWIDCDTGFDDLIAIGIAATAEDYEIVGISTVVGNTTLDNTTKNTLSACELFGLDVPVYRGAARPLAQAPQTIEGLLGEGGMGTRGRKLPEPSRSEEKTPAIIALIETLEEGPLSILATGPLTNLAMALNLRPDLVGNIKELVFMGGSATSGNHTAAAEFNTYADPESLAVLIELEVPMIMFGLNLTRQVMIQLEHEDQVREVGTDKAEILADHIGFYLRLVEKEKGKPMALHDPSAAAYLRWPECFTVEPMHIEVELAGKHSRGATVCELRVPRKAEANARLATEADGEKIMEHVIEVLRQASA